MTWTELSRSRILYFRSLAQLLLYNFISLPCHMKFTWCAIVILGWICEYIQNTFCECISHFWCLNILYVIKVSFRINMKRTDCRKVTVVKLITFVNLAPFVIPSVLRSMAQDQWLSSSSDHAQQFLCIYQYFKWN